MDIKTATAVIYLQNSIDLLKSYDPEISELILNIANILIQKYGISDSMMSEMKNISNDINEQVK